VRAGRYSPRAEAKRIPSPDPYRRRNFDELVANPPVRESGARAINGGVSQRQRKRTILATVGACAIGAAIAATLVAASPSPAPNLPSTGPKALIASVLRRASHPIAVSGTATTHVDLGLPQLPAISAGPVSGALGVLDDFSGDHTLRIWSSPDGVRVAELLPAAERAVFATTHAVWLWDSDTLTAYHVEAPSGAGAGTHDEGPAQLDPNGMAGKALHAIGPSTRVWVGTPATVAGRPVYPLLLAPRTSATLVGRIEIDVDSQTRTVLRVAVTPRGAASPALSTQFTDVSFDPIDPSVFQFTPPPGATVKPFSIPTGSHRTTTGHSAPAVRTFHRGWAEVVAVRVPARVLTTNRTAREIAKLLPYSGPLLSVRLEDRGTRTWLLAGMVPQSSLLAAASSLP
jgi:hypothetical protein